jgi:hypothetical protein
LTSDHVKELTEEVEKLAKENVGEVRRKERESEREARTRPWGWGAERMCVYEREREDVYTYV